MWGQKRERECWTRCGCTDLKEMLGRILLPQFLEKLSQGKWGEGAQVCGSLTIMPALSVGVI